LIVDFLFDFRQILVNFLFVLHQIWVNELAAKNKDVLKCFKVGDLLEKSSPFCPRGDKPEDEHNFELIVKWEPKRYKCVGECFGYAEEREHDPVPKIYCDQQLIVVQNLHHPFPETLYS
jgi:hypothetical protein